MTTAIPPLHALSWMTCRIPVRDALATYVSGGGEDFTPPRPVYETRWFPRPEGYRVLIPYDGGPYDERIFHIVKDAWDHVTCSACNVRIPAMTPCHVTRHGDFLVLCGSCHQSEVVEKLPLIQSLVVRVKQLLE